MRHGVGITTRNRPRTLDAALRHFRAFPNADTKFVVVDDSSDGGGESALLCKGAEIPGGVLYHKAPHRVGISGAKNACLWELRDCEHVFLFDDDCWPVTEGWADRWVEINESNGVGHSIFNIVDGLLLDRNSVFKSLMQVTGTLGVGKNEMTAFSNCFGPFLYFSRACLDALGGYEVNPPTWWGFEHAQMSLRAFNAGFTQGHRYLTPVNAQEMVYSVDLTYGMLKLLPPLDVDCLDAGSSVSPEEKDQGANLNSVLMSRSNIIYVPLEAPAWLT